MKYNVIIPSAGNSTRFAKNKDKLLYKINNEKIIFCSTIPFIEDENCEKVIIPTSEKNFSSFKKIFCLYHKVLIVKGANTRSQSVKNGFQYITKNCENVLIHDGARPFITKEIINKIFYELINSNEIIIPYINIYDSLFNSNELKYVKRENYKLIQTPQAFKKNILKETYENVKDIDAFNDELSLLLSNNKNYKVKFIEGNSKNKKITILSDIDI